MSDGGGHRVAASRRLSVCRAGRSRGVPHNSSRHAAHQVDPRQHEGCENYYEIISKPMDLGTIRYVLHHSTAMSHTPTTLLVHISCMHSKRLMASMGGGWVPGQYGSPEEVWNDLQLIWSNCRTFNGADSQVRCASIHALEQRPMLKHIPAVPWLARVNALHLMSGSSMASQTSSPCRGLYLASRWVVRPASSQCGYPRWRSVPGWRFVPFEEKLQ